jgi:hypothetical protein
MYEQTRRFFPEDINPYIYFNWLWKFHKFICIWRILFDSRYGWTHQKRDCFLPPHLLFFSSELVSLCLDSGKEKNPVEIFVTSSQFSPPSLTPWHQVLATPISRNPLECLGFTRGIKLNPDCIMKRRASQFRSRTRPRRSKLYVLLGPLYI